MHSSTSYANRTGRLLFPKPCTSSFASSKPAHSVNSRVSLLLSPRRRCRGLQSSTFNFQLSTCNLQLSTCNLQPTFNLQLATCNPQPAKCTAMTTIESVTAREILDSRGNPTVEAEVALS